MADLRNAPTQARSRKTLDDIMSAADRLFLAKGVDGATNTEIAAEAEVSIGSLYRFFPDKEALVNAYVERYVIELGVSASSMPELPESPTLDDLEYLVGEILDRSASVRRKFVGFSQVRMWRNEQGERPAQIVADGGLAVITALLESANLGFTEKQIDVISLVTLRCSYPVLELLPEVSKARGEALLDEVKLMIAAYIRAKVAELPT